MNYFQISLIALGLALNLLTSSIAGGMALRESSAGRKFSFALSIIFFQAIAIGAGLILGNRLGMISESHNAVIALAILLIMGIKILLDSIRNKPETKLFDVNDNRILMMVSLAESFTPLIVSISVGLLVSDVIIPWILALFFQLLAVATGLIASETMGEQSYKLRLGPVGGFILLAAALKMIINVIGF